MAASGPDQAASEPSTAGRSGLRKRLIAWFAHSKGLQFLSYDIYVRWVLAVVGAWALLWALILGYLYTKARAKTPPPATDAYVARAIDWRKDMQKGMRALRAGSTADAIALFQKVLVQIPDSPALRTLMKEAMRRQDMEVSTKDATARLEYYLKMGEEAFKRKDMGSARVFFQNALDVDPENAAAQEYLHKLQIRPRTRAAASPSELEKKTESVAAAPPPVPESAPAPLPASTAAPIAHIRFESPVPQGYVTVNADGAQVLRKEFNFFKKKGMFGKEFIQGAMEDSLTLSPGKHELKFWVTAKAEGFTAHAALTRQFTPGHSYHLALNLDKSSKSLSIDVKEQ